MVPPPPKYTHGLRFSNKQRKKKPFIVCQRGWANTGGFKYGKKLCNVKKNHPMADRCCDAVVTDGTRRHSTVGGGKERGEGVGRSG